MVIPSYHGNSGTRMNISCGRGLYLLGVVYTSKIPVLGKVSHRDEEFKARLVYRIRSCLKSNQTKLAMTKVAVGPAGLLIR